MNRISSFVLLSSVFVACSQGEAVGTDPLRPPSVTGCGKAPGGDRWKSHVLRFESSQPAIEVTIVRRYVEQGTGESQVYDLAGFSLLRDGMCRVVENASSLKYENSHHNWVDAAIAQIDGVSYRLDLTYNLDSEPWQWQFTLTGSPTSSSAGPALGPLSLRQTGGLAGWVNPRVAHVVISELAPVPSPEFKDASGAAEPWIELFNPGSDTLSLAGFHLSNNPAQPMLFSLPAGTTLAPHKYLVITADGEPTQGPLHTNFRLDPDGGFIRLSAPDGTSYGERPYPAVKGGSLVFDGEADRFVTQPTPTPGEGEPDI